MDSSSLRPAGRHSAFLRRKPSFTAPTRPPPLPPPPPPPAPSCVASLRSVRPHATGSSLACASAPNDADATAVAADRDWRRRVPRFGESGAPSSTVVTAAHPGHRSSACALASCGSPRRHQSTTQTATPAATARTSASARWIPSPHAPSVLALAACDRTAPLLRGGASAVRLVRPYRYLLTQFAESPDDNHNL